MSASEHRHEWVQAGPAESEMFQCACEASRGIVHDFISTTAADARQVAGPSYYTGCRTHRDSNTLELWLASAPAELVSELEELHPGIYVIHNDAPRPAYVLDELRDSFDWPARKSDGIKVVGVGPTVDGYLHVGVLEDVEGAQTKLDEIYGDDVVRVSQQAQAFALPLVAQVRDDP